MNVEEIFCASVATVSGPNAGSVGNAGTEEVGRGRTMSVCPNVTLGGHVDADDRGFSPGEETNQILQEELGSANITSTPKTLRGLFTPKDAAVC